jgi:hypothetical protein
LNIWEYVLNIIVFFAIQVTKLSRIIAKEWAPIVGLPEVDSSATLLGQVRFPLDLKGGTSSGRPQPGKNIIVNKAADLWQA